MDNKTKLKIIRVALLVLALLNLVLSTAGLSPIDVDSDTLTNFINDGWAIAMALWCCWKNFSVTKPHLQADEVAEAIKNGAQIVIEYRQGSERLMDANEIEHEALEPETPELDKIISEVAKTLDGVLQSNEEEVQS